MVDFATLNPNGALQLPLEIAKQFQPSDRFIGGMAGERLQPKCSMPSPLKVVEQTPTDEPLSLNEINDIVHQVRRQRKVE